MRNYYQIYNTIKSINNMLNTFIWTQFDQLEIIDPCADGVKLNKV